MAKDLEKNLEIVSEEVSKAAEDVKETMHDIGGWWHRSSTEDKITTILGLTLIITGLLMAGVSILSSKLFWGIVILVIGILSVSGYFNKRLKPLFSSSRKANKPVKKEAEVEKKVEKPTKKVVKKPAKKTKK